PTHRGSVRTVGWFHSRSYLAAALASARGLLLYRARDRRAAAPLPRHAARVNEAAHHALPHLVRDRLGGARDPRARESGRVRALGDRRHGSHDRAAQLRTRGHHRHGHRRGRARGCGARRSAARGDDPARPARPRRGRARTVRPPLAPRAPPRRPPPLLTRLSWRGWSRDSAAGETPPAVGSHPPPWRWWRVGRGGRERRGGGGAARSRGSADELLSEDVRRETREVVDALTLADELHRDARLLLHREHEP